MDEWKAVKCDCGAPNCKIWYMYKGKYRITFDKETTELVCMSVNARLAKRKLDQARHKQKRDEKKSALKQSASNTDHAMG
jgi:hypothetical protein